jgi:GNAT superfamily N-acetyltransferase
MTIRDATRDDYGSLVRLMRFTHAIPTTEQNLVDVEEKRTKDYPFLRQVVEKDSEIIAYCKSQRWEIPDPVRYILAIAVEPDHRRQGLGTKLYEIASSHALESGAKELWLQSVDGDEVGEGFAKRRGYTHCFYLQDLTLDLENCDLSPFQDAVDFAEQSGVTFASYADFEDNNANSRKLFALHQAVEHDVPVFGNDAFLNYDEWVKRVKGGKYFDPAGQILAVHGDQWVGLGAVGPFEPDVYFNLITGVLREYRNRKLGMALKVVSTRYAMSKGAKLIRTQNHGTNAPMRAINKKLGYAGLLGWNTWAKKIEG